MYIKGIDRYNKEVTCYFTLNNNISVPQEIRYFLHNINYIKCVQ